MPSDDEQLRRADSVLKGQLAQDFSSVLLKTIEAVESDPAQFRNLIYEMARARLQKVAWHRDPPMSVLEQRRIMLVLETAIERVETECTARDSTPLLAAAPTDIMGHDPDVAPSDVEVVVASHEPIMLVDEAPAQSYTVAARREGASIAHSGLPPAIKAALRLGAIAAAAAAIVIVADRQFHLLTTGPAAAPTVIAAAPTPTPPQPSPSPSQLPPNNTASIPAEPPVATPASEPARAAHVGPLPTVYGIYAVSDGKLFELEPLVGRVPDARIFMSAVITKPSQTVLPNGEVTFIIFRREIAASAPDHVAVRVIARVKRDLKFSKSGQPTTVKVDDAWAVRNVSFNYQVAPAPDSREMVLIKPENNDFTLPPGRYGLVINGLAYDFSIAGRITEPVQCLERTEAANGTFYSECRAL